jgi:hypothetical protein
MVWGILGVLATFLLVAGRVLHRREAHQPLQMPFRSGHVQGMAEAPMFPHHRLGRRN